MTQDPIFPRSPRETMSGWIYLPRFIDKIRLHLAGRLAPDYQANFTKGFDGAWLKAAGIAAEELISVVKQSLTDGEVADWVAKNVRTSESERNAFRDHVLNLGRPDNPEMHARLEMRKREAGLEGRADIQTFVDFIDADEKRM